MASPSLLEKKELPPEEVPILLPPQKKSKKIFFIPLLTGVLSFFIGLFLFLPSDILFYLILQEVQKNHPQWSIRAEKWDFSLYQGELEGEKIEVENPSFSIRLQKFHGEFSFFSLFQEILDAKVKISQGKAFFSQGELSFSSLKGSLYISSEKKNTPEGRISGILHRGILKLTSEVPFIGNLPPIPIEKVLIQGRGSRNHLRIQKLRIKTPFLEARGSGDFFFPQQISLEVEISFLMPFEEKFPDIKALLEGMGYWKEERKLRLRIKGMLSSLSYEVLQ